MRCPRFVTLAAVVAFAAAPGIGAALAPAWLPVRLEQYVTQHVKLSPVQRTGLLQGQAVTRLLPADPSKEVSVFGAVWIAAPIPRYLDAIKDIEQFEKGAETLPVAVVRRSGQEELMLEVGSKFTQGLRAERVRCVLASARRSAVVGLVADQEIVLAWVNRLARCRQGLTEQAKWSLSFEKVDAGDEPGEVAPRIDMDATSPPQFSHQF